jgi:hypothetical protein
MKNQPSNPQRLYHYCSIETFHSIVTDGSIRLSSMQVSNDFLEGKLIERLWREFAEKDGWGSEQLFMLDIILRSVSTMLDGYAMCLSEASDLLSQWRGYANDGTGVCIGFDHSFLGSLANISNLEAARVNRGKGFRLVKVAYSDHEHREILNPWFDNLRGKVNLILDAQREYATDLHSPIRSEDISIAFAGRFQEARNLIEYFRSSIEFTLKSDAFKEEQEWRLLTSGTPYQQVEFHAANGRLVPFITVPFQERDTAIASVMLGPRCRIDESVISLCLQSSGYHPVEIGRSRASYR